MFSSFPQPYPQMHPRPRAADQHSRRFGEEPRRLEDDFGPGRNAERLDDDTDSAQRALHWPSRGRRRPFFPIWGDQVAQEQIRALAVAADPFLTMSGDKIVVLAAHAAVPAMYEFRGQVAAGGLMSYGVDVVEV